MRSTKYSGQLSSSHYEKQIAELRNQHEKQIAELRNQLQQAQETILQLRQLLQVQGGNRYKGVKLTKNQGTIVDMLFTTNGICTKESLYEKLYLSRQGYKPDRKIIREMLCVIRKKLEPYGVNIETVYDVGYTMTSEGKARLSGLIQQT